MSVAGACPLCGLTHQMRRPKLLYGHHVCKKCYNGFANRRQFAFIIDSFLFRGGGFALGMLVGVALVSAQVDPEMFQVYALPLDVLLLAAFFCKDGFSGHSPGKAICGVQAIDVRTGRPIGFGSSFKRNLPLMIPLMVFIVGVQLCRGTRTGDGWAHSRVVWKKYASHPIFTGQPMTAQVLEAEGVPIPLVPDDGNPYRPPLT